MRWMLLVLAGCGVADEACPLDAAVPATTSELLDGYGTLPEWIAAVEADCADGTIGVLRVQVCAEGCAGGRVEVETVGTNEAWRWNGSSWEYDGLMEVYLWSEGVQFSPAGMPLGSRYQPSAPSPGTESYFGDYQYSSGCGVVRAEACGQAFLHPELDCTVGAGCDPDGDGVSAEEGDCAPEDGSRAPGMEDPAGDGVDQDCGGADGPG